MNDTPPQYIDGPHGRLAYRQTPPGDPTRPSILWLGGFRSDMLGTKAEYLDAWARANNRSFCRFDYSGHGESDGRFVDGTISTWRDDAAAVLTQICEGPQILVGSSMGGWIASLLAIAHPDRIAGIVFIAPAPDFTERLMWPAFTGEQQKTIIETGQLAQPSDYSDEPEIITRALIEDGRQNLIMNAPIPIHCPVRIQQGMRDDAVPHAHAIVFSELLASDDVVLTISKIGDHRLSTDEDLVRLKTAIEEL